MDEIKLPDEMRDMLRASWHRYLDQLQPLRPQLHAYCRRLTRDLWDAEDLVQESLLKAFSRDAWAPGQHRSVPLSDAGTRRVVRGLSLCGEP